jgi:DNA-binding transcriptional MerR regulator
VRIGQLAQRAGVSVRALRHYEQAGLIHAERSANGYRDYPDATLTRVTNIRHLLGAGLTVEDVRGTFLACLDDDVTTARPAESAVRVAAARLAAVDARIAGQVALRERLVEALAGRFDR